MKAPAFWDAGSGGATASLLTPLGCLYALAGRLRQRLAKPGYRPRMPVVCVGNAVLGGAGKTPAALALAEILKADGLTPHFLSRGYGGRENGPLQVDPDRHTAHDVGDEPLLLASEAPCWIAADRKAGAIAIEKAHADALIMDDGFQNPTLRKDFSLLVVDGGFGLGNDRVFPAGPLREPWDDACARADAIVVVGDDVNNIASRARPDVPVLSARLIPDGNHGLSKGERVLAFAGIGRPSKFFETIHELGADIVDTLSYPDHHPYSDADWQRIRDRAKAEQATPVTTAKDAVRLSSEARQSVRVVSVSLEFDDPARLKQLLKEKLAG